MIEKVDIPDFLDLNQTSGEGGSIVEISEVAGRLCLRILSGKNEAEIDFEDLEKAWNAVSG